MASATSESYCNHLRGQLKEWERSFRSRKGRFPKQSDFEALQTDGSARGRLLHAAYLALNRATGDSFVKVCTTPPISSLPLLCPSPPGVSRVLFSRLSEPATFGRWCSRGGPTPPFPRRQALPWGRRRIERGIWKSFLIHWSWHALLWRVRLVRISRSVWNTWCTHGGLWRPLTAPADSVFLPQTTDRQSREKVLS